MWYLSLGALVHKSLKRRKRNENERESLSACFEVFLLTEIQLDGNLRFLAFHALFVLV